MPFNLCYSPKRYCVYDNGKPASAKFFPQLGEIEGWDNHKFDSWPKAVAYASMWVGQIIQPEDLLKPYDYSGYGDIIEVREENA